MTQPRISVVIPVYNGASVIGRALDSAFEQNFAGSEIVVVDDGSTDATPGVLGSYGDRIRVVRQQNQGSPSARNAGVAASRAPYVAFLDCDDIWLPGRLAKTVAAIDSEREAVLSYSDAIPIDEHDQPIASSYVPPDKTRPPSMEDLLGGWWGILPSTCVIRREAYARCGGFHERFKGSRGFADYFFFLKLREQGPFVYVPEQLVRYRRLPFVDRMEKYAPGFKTFSEFVCQRYGAAGEAGVRKQARSYAWLLTEWAADSLTRGDLIMARRALKCASRYERLDRRSRMRMLRTYLPRAVALALTSSKRRAMAASGVTRERLNFY